MSVSTPPRRSRSADAPARDELEALIEALIEEARQRARRRRRRYGACIVLAALALGGVYFGFDHAGDGATGTPSGAAGSPDGAAVAAARGTGRWGPSNGPDGGPVSALAVAPSAPGIVYVGTGRGVFKSTNGGGSWRSAGLAGRQIVSLAIDPRTPATVYAARNESVDSELRQGIFKSTNGGRTWRALGFKGRLVAVAADSKTVFAAAGDFTGGGLAVVRSRDGGRSWHSIRRGLPSTYLWALALDPTSPDTIYAAMGSRGVFKSTDGGGSWDPANGPVGSNHMTALALDPRHPKTIYAGTHAGVRVSRDGGRTWENVDHRMAGDNEVWSLAVDPHDSLTVFATTYCSGVFKTSDGGRSWRRANVGLEPECPLSHSALAIAPRGPGTLYLGAGPGVFRSVDRGARWRPSNEGLSLTTVSALAVDPQNPRAVYASAGGRGLFRSIDGGARWRPVASGLASVNLVAVSPSNARLVLAAGSGRLAQSTNAGRSWQPANAGFRGKSVTALAIAGEQAYLGTSAFGIFGSTNSGRSWHALGPPNIRYVESLAVGSADPSFVYAGSTGSDARGLYRSSDAGRTWHRVTDALEDTDIFAVAVDPKNSATVYIGTGASGVYKSMDAGATWQRAASGLPRITIKVTSRSGEVTRLRLTARVTALAIDPAQPRTLYTATAGSGISRSTDAGQTWRPFNSGLVVRRIRSLALDQEGRRLYAGTEGGGVVALRVDS